MTLSEMVEEKKRLQEITNSTMEGVDQRFANGRLAAKREAEERLQQLAVEFTKRVQEQSALVFVVTKNRDDQATAKLVSQEQGAVVISAEQLYDQVGLAVQSFAANNGTFVSGCIGGTETALLELMNVYGIEGEVRIGGEFLEVPIADFNDLRSVIKSICAKYSFNQSLRACVTATQLVQQASRLDVTEEPLPVVVLGLDSVADAATFRQFLFPNRPSVIADLTAVSNVENGLKVAASKLGQILSSNQEIKE